VFANVIRNAIEAVPHRAARLRCMYLLHKNGTASDDRVHGGSLPIPDRASVRRTFSTPSSQPWVRMAGGSDLGSAVELS
jgi:hypothetical protein